MRRTDPSTRRQAGGLAPAVAGLALLVVACSPGEPAEEPAEVDGAEQQDAPSDVEADEGPADEEPDDQAGDDQTADDQTADDQAGDDQAVADQADDAPSGSAPTEGDLPDGWEVLALDDAQTGAFTIGAPDDPVVWTVGDPLTNLAEVVDGTAWWEFWAPRLEPLDPEISNIRAMIVDPAPETVGGGDTGGPGDDEQGSADEPLVLQINVTPYDLDVDPDDAEAIAEIYRAVLQAQGSTVNDAGTVAWAGTRVAEVVHTVPEAVVPAARDVRQWFYPAADEVALWSVQCDAPADAEVDERCAVALASFRPPG